MMKLLPSKSRWVFMLFVILLIGCQTNWDRIYHDDYAVWSDMDTDGDWTLAAETAVRATTLAHQTPADINEFCPQYLSLSTDLKILFWAGLLSAMAKYESDFDPDTAYTEAIRDNQGNAVVSRGLLQISFESANQKRYACNIHNERELHDPTTNLTCGARILSRWVEVDGVVARGAHKNSGGARYWSVLRPSSNSLSRIRAITRRFEFCGA